MPQKRPISQLFCNQQIELLKGKAQDIILLWRSRQKGYADNTAQLIKIEWISYKEFTHRRRDDAMNLFCMKSIILS